MITVKGASASRLWVEAVRAVLRHGAPCDPRGLSTLEIVDAHLILDQPRRRLVHVAPSRVLNAAFAAAETVWILSGSDDEWIYTYNRRLTEFTDDDVLRGAYGPRLRNWAGSIDQLDQVRRQLLADRSSRRAVIQMWDPLRDHQGHRDVPCTLGYWFALRDDRLDMHTMMRSQDLWLGFCYDLYATTVLHELMAGWVGAQPGAYHHHVGSLHLYEEHLPAASALASSHVADALAEPSSTDGEMTPLTLPWDDLDSVLRTVLDGRTCDHPGWAETSAVMCSYRLYKSGDRAGARDLARCVQGPLATALTAWYDHLGQSTHPDPASAPTTTGTRGTP